MPICFVIQPFDRGAFDKRYEDVFVPAIEAAGLEPYRVDRDPAAVIPIDEIERGIRSADACLADISEPNPNVWFELGFALSAAKPVVMVWRETPGGKLPFDVQHRAVISYRLESSRDFDELKQRITARLKAALQKERTLEDLAGSSVVVPVAGLSNLEIVGLVTVAENADAPDSYVPIHAIRQDMEKRGFTKVAVTIAMGHLLKKELVLSTTIEEESGYGTHSYVAFGLKQSGMDWLLANQGRLALKKGEAEAQDDDIDIPF